METSENMPVVIDTAAEITLARAPEIVLAEAQRAAKALQGVVSQKAKPVFFNNEQFLEYEDLQLLARFFGITAKVVSSSFIEVDGVKGWEARAVAIRADGAELSAAEAMCLSDEPPWRGKPSFQIRSMSQTRALAKCLRNTIGWIAVLAGYRATPAEEIEGLIKAPATAAARSTAPTARDQLRRALEAWPEDERPGILKMASHFTNSKGEDRWIENLDDAKLTDKWIFGTIARTKSLAKKRIEDVPKEIE